MYYSGFINNMNECEMFYFNPRKLISATIVVMLCCIMIFMKLQLNRSSLYEPKNDVFTSCISTNVSLTVMPKNKQNYDNHVQKSSTKLLLPINVSTQYDCRKIFAGSKSEQRRAKEAPPHEHLPPEYYINLAKNCSLFKQTRRYILQPLTTEEAGFPIAYSILMFKDVEKTERLLRAIYRPQNYYCIHVDKTSHSDIHEAMASIAACFNHVFIASVTFDVQWGKFSVLEPEFQCMEDLWKYKDWRYFINLTGQEFPLKTNLEIVKILKIFNGANNLEGSLKRFMPYRIKLHGFFTQETPKYNYTFTYGSVHIVVQRSFIDYLIHNETALYLRSWLNETIVPDETLFTTLNYSPQFGIPGTYKGEPESEPAEMKNGSYPINPFLARFKNWRDENHLDFQWPCAGKISREICILGVGDLPLLASRKELFANKFHADFQPHAFDCLEQRHYNRTIEQLSPDYQFNDTYYRNLKFIHNVIR